MWPGHVIAPKMSVDGCVRRSERTVKRKSKRCLKNNLLLSSVKQSAVGNYFFRSLPPKEGSSFSFVFALIFLIELRLFSRCCCYVLLAHSCKYSFVNVTVRLFTGPWGRIRKWSRENKSAFLPCAAERLGTMADRRLS